jgi:hypothetical protein
MGIMKNIKVMGKRTGSVRQTIVADGPDGPIYLLRDKWVAATKSTQVWWTSDVNKAKVWKYPGNAAVWLKSRHVTALMTGARVLNVRTVPEWAATNV